MPYSHPGIQAGGGFLSPVGIDLQVTEGRHTDREAMCLAWKQRTTLFFCPTTEMGFRTSKTSCSEDCVLSHFGRV